jgi:3(or 17)beta-hydroxysteroid dehydrogenase
MGRLQGKVAIVTGGAMGLGEADARAFAREGAKVVVCDVNRELGAAVAKDIGGEFRFLDVTQEQAWIELIDHVVKTHGGLHVLVNNAGIVEAGNIETQTADEWRRVMAVSADGTFFGCKYAVPAMAKSGGGSIINMASICSKFGVHTVTAYCAAKGAIEALTRAVAAHCLVQKNKVRCNSLHPGTINTPMVQSMGLKMAAAGLIPEQNPTSPPPNTYVPLGEPSDIANLAVFLASDESKFISGQEFVPDGGISTIMASLPA